MGELADAEPLLRPAGGGVPGDDRSGPGRGGERNGVVPREPLLDAARSHRCVELTLRHRLNSGTVEIHTPAGSMLVSHRLAPAGAGAIVRTPAHHDLLEAAVLSAFMTARPCDRKSNRPPGAAALTEAARLLGPEGGNVVIDLAHYAELVEVSGT